MLGSSLVAAQPVASRVVLSSIELVIVNLKLYCSVQLCRLTLYDSIILTLTYSAQQRLQEILQKRYFVVNVIRSQIGYIL
jgi:hypothetical protein